MGLTTGGHQGTHDRGIAWVHQIRSDRERSRSATSPCRCCQARAETDKQQVLRSPAPLRNGVLQQRSWSLPQLHFDRGLGLRGHPSGISTRLHAMAQPRARALSTRRLAPLFWAWAAGSCRTSAAREPANMPLRLWQELPAPFRIPQPNASNRPPITGPSSGRHPQNLHNAAGSAASRRFSRRLVTPFAARTVPTWPCLLGPLVPSGLQCRPRARPPPVGAERGPGSRSAASRPDDWLPHCVTRWPTPTVSLLPRSHGNRYRPCSGPRPLVEGCPGLAPPSSPSPSPPLKLRAVISKLLNCHRWRNPAAAPTTPDDRDSWPYRLRALPLTQACGASGPRPTHP